MPVWEAIYVVIIASKTGWTEDHIRHHLPLSRGWAYYHAARLLEGERCRWPGRQSTISKHIDSVKKWVRSLRKTTSRP
jgi:hypothetical protein